MNKKNYFKYSDKKLKQTKTYQHYRVEIVKNCAVELKKQQQRLMCLVSFISLIKQNLIKGLCLMTLFHFSTNRRREIILYVRDDDSIRQVTIRLGLKNSCRTCEISSKVTQYNETNFRFAEIHFRSTFQFYNSIN